MNKAPTIAIDFDGTLVENKFPEIGKPIPQIVEACKLLQNAGCKLILWTSRNGESLDIAVKFCQEVLGLSFSAVNQNLPEVQEEYGGDTRKVFADVYIDDRAYFPNLAFTTNHEDIMTSVLRGIFSAS